MEGILEIGGITEVLGFRGYSQTAFITAGCYYYLLLITRPTTVLYILYRVDVETKGKGKRID